MIDLPVWALLIACSGARTADARRRPMLPARRRRERLRGNRWRELPVWAGLTQDGSVLELWVGDRHLDNHRDGADDAGADELPPQLRDRLVGRARGRRPGQRGAVGARPRRAHLCQLRHARPAAASA